MKHVHFILLLLVFSALHAQHGLVSSGGNTLGPTGSVSYSIGQPFVTHHESIQGSVSEGVQQPYEISVILRVGESMHAATSCEVFPNPTRDKLILKMADLDMLQLSYLLLDINGKFFSRDVIIDHETSIDMLWLLPGIYFLKVLNHQKDFITFKIIKY